MIVLVLICFVVIICGDLGIFKNGIRIVYCGFYYFGYVVYKCIRRYRMDGVFRIYCLRDGNWIKFKFRCLGL